MSRVEKSLREFKRRIIELYDLAMTDLSMSHLSGKRKPILTSNEVLLVCLIKNGKVFLKPFLEHYRRIGIAHFVFVDNGSTDGTLEVLNTHGDVTVYGSSLPAKRYECYMRRWAIRKFAMNRWCLCVDADEFFDYLHDDALSIKDLVAYLDDSGYNCIVTQMLDMFPDGPLTTVHADLGSSIPFLDTHNYYDLSRIDEFDYHGCTRAGFDYFTRNNSIGSPKIKWLFGGIRLMEFDAYVCLTKHSLLRVSAGVVPQVHAHCSSGVSCADISAVVRHYKFAGGFRERVEADVKAMTWETGETERYFDGLSRNKSLSLRRPTSKRYSGANSLVSAGFLISSEKFEAWVASHRPVS
jgi:glycosyltransferase involved in cell wall biosynthesis